MSDFSKDGQLCKQCDVRRHKNTKKKYDMLAAEYIAYKLCGLKYGVEDYSIQ
jgi:hypothetical protein